MGSRAVALVCRDLEAARHSSARPAMPWAQSGHGPAVRLGLRRAFLELKRHDALHACEDGVHHDLAKPFDSKAAAEMSEERRLEGASQRFAHFLQ